MLASPEAASSEYVLREIDWWLQHRDPQSILIIVTAGVLPWDREARSADTNSALPPQLAGLQEPGLSVDARGWARDASGIDRRSAECTDTAASLLARFTGRDKGVLLSENVRRLRRILISASVAILSLVILAIAAAVFAVGQQRARHVAEENERQAQSLALAKTSSDLLAVRPDIAALLALDAYRLDETTQARGALIDGLTAVGTPGTVGVLHGPDGAVTSIATSADGKTIATGGSDKLIRLWNAATRRPLGKPLRGSTNVVEHLAFVRGGSHLVSTDGNVLRLWDLGARVERAATRAPNADQITSLAATGRGDIVATGSSEELRINGSYVQIWDTTTGKLRGKSILTPSLNGIQGLAFAPDGRTIATGGDAESGIEFYDLRRRTRTGPRISADPDWVESLAFHPSGKRLASLGADGRLREWNPETGKELGRAAQSRTDRSGTVAYTPDGQSLLTAGEPSGLIRRWATESHTPRGRSLTGHSDTVVGLAVAKNGELASASSDGTARLWRPDTPNGYGSGVVPQTDVDNASNDAATLSPDGKWLVVAFGGPLGPARNEQGPVGVWRMSDRQLVRSIGNDASEPESVIFSTDGALLLVVGEESAIYDGRTFALVRSGLPSAVAGAISPNGRTIALAGPDNETRLWDIRSGKPVGNLRLPASDFATDYVPRSLAFGPTGEWLATTTDDNRVRFVSTRTGERFGKDLVGHEQVIWQLRIANDGRTVGTASGDNTVRLWNVASRKQLGGPLRGNRDSVFALTFGTDGKTLASAGWDDTVRLWDVGSRKQIGAPLLMPGQRVFGVTAARRGAAGDLVGLSEAGQIHIWPGLLSPSRGNAERALCRLIGGGLSDAERRRFATGLRTTSAC